MNLDELIIAWFCVIDDLLPRLSGGSRCPSADQSHP
jgi:hypothetical protein